MSMPFRWDAALRRLREVQQQLVCVDHRNLYPLQHPAAPAREEELAEVEAALGVTLDGHVRDLLHVADGWRGLYGRVDLFGTQQLRGSAALSHARDLLADLEANGALRAARVQRAHLLPIAAARDDLDLFALQLPGAPRPGGIIWFAQEEIERYPDARGFFTAMIEANEDLITLITSTQRLDEVEVSR